MWRVLHSCEFLSALPLAPSVSHHSAWLPVAVALFIFLSVTTCITCQSLIFHSPSLSLHVCRHSFVLFFRPLLFLSPSISVFFPRFSSVITHLPLVFCFVYVILSELLFCGNQWLCPYTCQCVVKNHSLQLFRPSGAQQIYTYMSAHSQAVTLFLPLSLCLAACSHYFFGVLHFMFLSCHGQHNAFCGGFEILYTQTFWHYFKTSAQLCRCACKWLVLCYLSVKKYSFQLKQKGLHKKAHTKNSAARPKRLF